MEAKTSVPSVYRTPPFPHNLTLSSSSTPSPFLQPVFFAILDGFLEHPHPMTETQRTREVGSEVRLTQEEQDVARRLSRMPADVQAAIRQTLPAPAQETTAAPATREAPARREAPATQLQAAETVAHQESEIHGHAASMADGQRGHATPGQSANEHLGSGNMPPEGDVGTKTWRLAKTAALSAGVGAGLLAVTQGTGLSNLAIFSVPALHSAAAGITSAATSVAGWTPWLSWLSYPLKAAAWAVPGLAAGAATVGGLWALGKIREGAERREFYKHNKDGRFQQKTFLQNVAGGAGLLLSPLKLIPGIPRAIGSAAGWTAEKIGDGAAWVGKHAGIVVKGAGVGTLVGGTLLIAGALANPAAAIIVGAGTAGAYIFLNRTGASSSGESAAPH